MERLVETVGTKGKTYGAIVVAEAGKALLSYQLICAYFLNPVALQSRHLTVACEVRDGKMFIDLKDSKTLFATAVLVEQ